MQTALVLALVLSVACIQFLPGDAAPQAQGTGYLDFCEVNEQEKVKFLNCLQDKIPKLRELLQESGQRPQDLLTSICTDNDGDNPEELTQDMAQEWSVIEECLSQIA
ncbi:uncharacterized protein LOC144110732 [Amblyomma americanum]